MAFLPWAAQAQFSYEQFTFTTIDRPGADWTVVNGIGRHLLGPHGQTTIVGAYHDIFGKHAFSLSGPNWTTIPLPPDAIENEALGVNNRGDIVGTYTVDVNGHHNYYTKGFRLESGIQTDVGGVALRCDPDHKCIELIASGINNYGAIVGSWDFSLFDNNYGGHGLYISPNGTSDFYTEIIAPSTQDAQYTRATAINDLGTILCTFFTLSSNTPVHSYITSNLPNASGTTFDVPNAHSTWLRGVNNQNQMVGYYWDGGNPVKYHGFLWNPSTQKLIALDYPGASDTQINGITDPDPVTGEIQVVGTYWSYPGGIKHGFLATPTPVNALPN